MASLRKNFLTLRTGFHRLEDGALVLALVSMLVMALTQILLRNLFDSGFLWAVGCHPRCHGRDARQKPYQY